MSKEQADIQMECKPVVERNREKLDKIKVQGAASHRGAVKEKLPNIVPVRRGSRAVRGFVVRPVVRGALNVQVL